MSFRSGLRKFKPGQSAHVRHPWRAFALIGLLAVLGLVVLMLLRGPH
jgi:hypothetical protein